MALRVEGQDDDVQRLERLAATNGDAPVAQPPRTRWTATELVATEFPEPPHTPLHSVHHIHSRR